MSVVCTPSQAKKISQQLFPGMNYLVRLKKRMEAQGFPHNDKLYLLVCDAYDAMHWLSGLAYDQRGRLASQRANGANDNFKGVVATLFGSGTANFRLALVWATLTTLARVDDRCGPRRSVAQEL